MGNANTNPHQLSATAPFYFEIYEIKEDGEVTIVMISNGERTEIPYGPLSVDTSDGGAVILSSTGETYTLKDGKMSAEYPSGARTVFEKTDEIPE